MRHYPKNSLQAATRIVALAVLADGQLQAREFEALRRSQVAARLGLCAEDFDRVLQEFCSDLLSSAKVDADAHCQVSPAIVERLLADIDHPLLQAELARLVVSVIDADNTLHRGESLLFKALLQHWPCIGGQRVSEAPAVPQLPAYGAEARIY
ncbi:hypothetical protein [Uliginosibacterium sediminicola]|uniref:Tellurite resistance protein TerB n=1 Tax=Uliginosibacterium sediminicola TaxID=2024550 RepID=A0ABU9YZ36_9RHOO